MVECVPCKTLSPFLLDRPSMPPPSTADELVDLIRRGNLTDESRLEAFLRQLPTPLPEKPEDLARLLIQGELLTRFQADSLLQGKYKGFHVGEYRVLQPLGAGGMAAVYLCQHPDGRKVAVKVLAKERAEDSEIRKRFEREGRTVSALDHPNIVRAFEMGLDAKRHFLVMEYVEGATCCSTWSRRAAAHPNACDWIRQAAVALQHIHEMNLVHRDIKPANLLIDKKGTVKVFNMGLAKVFGDDQTILTKRVVGTADFIAPEQTYDSHHVDIRADIYGLGLTFYFLLTGQVPFGTGTVVQKILAQRTMEPPSLTSVRPEIPAFLAAVVERMIAKDPDFRYQTPAEVIEALAMWGS